MKKILLIGLIVCLFLISGCDGIPDKENDPLQPIVPLELTEEQCKEFKDFENYASFRYKDEKCKDHQIITCRNIDSLLIKEKIPEEKYTSTKAKELRHLCFLNLAIRYKNDNICDYLRERGQDMYWYCMARLRYGESACSNIDMSYWHDKCLKNT